MDDLERVLRLVAYPSHAQVGCPSVHDRLALEDDLRVTAGDADGVVDARHSADRLEHSNRDQCPLFCRAGVETADLERLLTADDDSDALLGIAEDRVECCVQG